MEVEIANINNPCMHDSEDDEFVDIESNIEFNTKLEERVSALRALMDNVKFNLEQEKALWKKEIEDSEKLSTAIVMCKCDETSSISTDVQSDIEPTLNDMSILDYQQKLNVYQDALAKARLERRLHLRRHLAANAYRRRLLEVENMCNMELMKVKQSVQFLQPLAAIASEWNYDLNEPITTLDDEITGGLKVKKDIDMKRDQFMTMENFSNRIQSETKELRLRKSPASPAHSSMGTRTTSSLVHEEDEDTLMMTRLASMNWYNNEINFAGFNPLM